MHKIVEPRGLNVEVVVAAGLQTLKVEDAVVVVVGHVGAHILLALEQLHHGAVDGRVSVHAAGLVGVERVGQRVVLVLNCAHDVTGGLRGEVPVVGAAASHTHALLPAELLVQGAVARGVISVEEALHDKSG